jgi:hypothetical protein
MNGGQVSVLKERDEVGYRNRQQCPYSTRTKLTLTSLLERKDGRRLEAQVGLEVLGNLTHKTLERQLADEELGALLIATNLTESDGSGAETMRLLDTASGLGRTLAGLLGGELLAGRLASGGLAGGLLYLSVCICTISIFGRAGFVWRCRGGRAGGRCAEIGWRSERWGAMRDRPDKRKQNTKG